MIHNLSAIKSKMKDQPRGQRIYAFFDGDFSKLSARQIAEMEKIINKGNKKTLAIIVKCA